ncbi:MAG: GGDEF domain-containing protein [Candidatus Korobacteraceae bacterium]|jgi:diguanylate cyclase (GGDEF)-like protein
MLLDPPVLKPPEPEDFLVEPLLQIGAETLCFRGSAINAILRAHLLGRQGLPLDEALGQLFDLASEVVYYDGGFAFFCEEEERHMRLRVVRDVRRTLEGEKLAGANLLNYWTAKYWRPLLLRLGQHPQVDGLLRGIGAGCVLAVPLFAGNRPRGTLQLFGVNPACFATLDAQLLWILALAAERLFPGGASQSPAAAAQGKCEERLERELARAERHQKALTLLLLEIDRFQLVNDVHGQQAGEAVRSEVFAALTRLVRGLDCVLRYGNGGFAVILPDTTTAGGYCVAERLKQDLEETCFSADTPSSCVRLTMSVGLAVYPADAQSARELLQTAGLALCEAQHNSRNRIAVYSELRDGGGQSPAAYPTPRGLPRELARAAAASATPGHAEVPANVPRPATPVKQVIGAEAAASDLASPDWVRICDFGNLPPVAPPLPAQPKPPAIAAGEFHPSAPKTGAPGTPLPIPAFGTVLPAEKLPLASLPAYGHVRTETGSPAIPAAAFARVQPGATKDMSAPSAAFTPAPAKAAPAVDAAPQLVSKHAVSEPRVYAGMRREKRMNIALPVQVWGMDSNGELFEQDATTMDITTVGARLKGITHRLERGCVVGIKHQNSKARFRVKWVGAERSQAQGQIGVRLLDEGKLIWGMALRRVLGDDFTDGSPKHGLRPN